MIKDTVLLTRYLHLSAIIIPGSNINKTPRPAHRVILHFDLDCFYAQVEMIRNPGLRDVPLGKDSVSIE